jgi:hydrogenase-4 component F
MIIILLFSILISFGLGILFTVGKYDQKQLMKIPAFTALAVFVLFLPIEIKVLQTGPIGLISNNLLFDALAIYHIFLVNIIFLATSIYSVGYFRKHAEKHGEYSISFVRRYTILWQLFHLLLLVVLMSNNIGLMWVALEATTLISAFLIIQPSNPLSIEAMWKYLIVCSVGIAFGFMGTILTVAACDNSITEPIFLFTQLVEHVDLINPKLMLLAFIFIVVGFGTKSGLSPMHTWLPDAHSQAPTPVSAVFSGVMLNCAFFGIMRYMPITELAMGNEGHARSILLALGIISVIFAVIFIPMQHDVKRLLAYCSVEHIGIIAIGLGLGGIGTFAALLHIINHSFSKVLAFFSAGYISEEYGTRDMRKIKAAVQHMPVWGTTFFTAMLILVGVAPFAIFFSEFLIMKEAFFSGRYVIIAFFMIATIAIFISILKLVLNVSFGINSDTKIQKEKVGHLIKSIIIAMFFVLLLLGLWIPSPFSDFLKTATDIVQNGAKL